MKRILYLVTFTIAASCCTASTATQPDAAVDGPAVDAALPDGVQDAEQADARHLDRPDAGVLPLCSDVCPGSELAAWWIDGSYWWSYCLPSYDRCVDPAQCGSSCPPSSP